MTEPLDLLDQPLRDRPASGRRSRPLPNWCYTSANWYALEVERIFMKVWNYVGIPVRYRTRATSSPWSRGAIIVITGDDGEVRAFHNSCRHRGSKIAWGEGNCGRSPAHTTLGPTRATVP